MDTFTEKKKDVNHSVLLLLGKKKLPAEIFPSKLILEYSRLSMGWGWITLSAHTSTPAAPRQQHE